jgi:hypothetical protein
VVSGKEHRRFDSGTIALAFSPSGKVLAIGTIEEKDVGKGWSERKWTIELLEMASGQEIRRLAAEQSFVFCLAFAPDGRTLASGSGDCTILLWDVTGRMKGGQLQPARLTAEQVDRLWTDLAGAAPRAYHAIWNLVAAPDKALPLLGERLRPVPAADPQHLARLIADLDSNQFTVREEATRELAKLGEQAAPALTKALKESPSAEVRRRGAQLLDKFESSPSPDRLRGIRAVEVLEQLATPAALDLLNTLARGTPDARLTQEAKASLARLRLRSGTGASTRSRP